MSRYWNVLCVRMAVSGPDRGWAWAVAFAACAINFIVAGLGRMSGILFVAFIEIFHLDRRGAAVPFSLRSSMRNLMGPVVGILGQKYGIQKVILCGAVTSTVGAACCFFANDIFWITFLWGGLGGVGAALTTCIVQVRIGQYFVKHRATAAGMGFSGGCVGSFLFPALLEIMLKMKLKKQKMEVTTSYTNEVAILEDGVRINKLDDFERNNIKYSLNNDVDEGSPDVLLLQEHNTLVLKLLTMNLPDCNINNAPQENCQNQKVIETCIKQSLEDLYWKQSQSDRVNQSSNLSKNNILNDMMQKNDIKYICSKKSQSFRLGKSLSVESITKNKSMPDITKMTKDISSNYVLLRMREVFGMETSNILAKFPTESKDNILKVLKELKKLYRSHKHFYKVLEDEQIRVSNEQKEDSNSILSHIKTAVRMFANPFFVLTCLCRSVHFITFMPIVTAIVDVAIDKGLKQEDGKYVIAALSMGDLLGRLCLGWVTDRGFMTLPKFMLVVMVIQGANIATLPLMQAEWAIYLSLGFFGMLQGSLFIRHSVLVLKYMGSHEQSIAMGSINFFSGILGFMLPLYIGYFRDTLGSYDYIFYINGGLAAAIGLLWIFEPYFIRWQSPGKVTDNTSS
ncbi:hypothetical protein JTE90_019106 [Oedothorax gibbosus]|uniref:Monocarboxylate transporter n=1 Tax=Oedothorax gibbosus TaxID=931172 RepID=A0AAV6V9K0_9ARAC|nr:hypothetical protein JTE90_019106 [Oedothorax gibbosus]